MPTIAPISRFFDAPITLIIKSVPMLPEPMIAQGIFVNSSLILANAARTEPRPEMRASYTSPLLTVTIGPSAPDITVSPSFKGRPTFAMVLASQSVADSGSPRQAAPAPTETSLPPCSITMPQSLSSRPSSFFGGSAEHVEAGGGVVGDRVEDADLPVGNARIDDLDRRQRKFDRAQDVGDGQALVVEVAPDDEGDLGLDLGLDQLVAGDVPAVWNGHVVEQHAVVGLIDAELPLHGERGEADLPADQPAPAPSQRLVLISWAA